MTERDREQIIADERSVELGYRLDVNEHHREILRNIAQFIWNSWRSNFTVRFPADTELIGRIALSHTDKELNGAFDYYIGKVPRIIPKPHEDYRVFSWAAPIACTFFNKTDHHDWCGSVTAVRVFAHSKDVISDFEDVISGPPASTQHFPERKLEIPKAPSLAIPPSPKPTQPPVAKVSDPSSETTQETAVSISKPEVTEEAEPKRDATSDNIPVETSYTKDSPSPVRAYSLVKRVLAAPKTNTMSTVLSTLQPDQYRAISAPIAQSQVLQGHPGTGKTIIGTHRIAYMLDSEAPDGAKLNARENVLLVGPTFEYARHVYGALSKLIDARNINRLNSVSLPTLMDNFAKLRPSKLPTETSNWRNVSKQLAGLVELAYASAQQKFGRNRPNADDVYGELRDLRIDATGLALDNDWVEFLSDLPRNVRTLREVGASTHRGLLAFLGVCTTPQTVQFGHIIVDEAQDIHPIEWEFLKKLRNSGGWTILGDLNQRRTDFTYDNWDEVAHVLGIMDSDYQAPVTQLGLGYRSSSEIMKVANRLLPSRERRVESLQTEGEKPRFVAVPRNSDISPHVYSEAEILLGKVGEGTVAIITVDPVATHRMLTKKDWAADRQDLTTWRMGERLLRVFPPERARGLEFDGVVVVEPSDFPVNIGRHGVLFTALSRANRFLTIVNSKPLPRGLRSGS